MALRRCVRALLRIARGRRRGRVASSRAPSRARHLGPALALGACSHGLLIALGAVAGALPSPRTGDAARALVFGVYRWVGGGRAIDARSLPIRIAVT